MIKTKLENKSKQTSFCRSHHFWVMSDGNTKNQGAVLVFKKPSLLTLHSIFVTHFFIHHLKLPNFLNPTHLAHIFSFSLLKIFYFLWDPPDPLPEYHTRVYIPPIFFSPSLSPNTQTPVLSSSPSTNSADLQLQWVAAASICGYIDLVLVIFEWVWCM